MVEAVGIEPTSNTDLARHHTIIYGARRETRTLTGFTPLESKSSAPTNYATLA